MWGALSDERTGVSFAIAAGPRQRSHSRVRVPSIPLWDVAIYICKDNHVSIYSIIFITIVQYTQMYLNN
jgi:hypothetical protein